MTESYENYGSLLTFNGSELGKCKVQDYPEPVMGRRSVTNHSSGGVAEQAPNGLVTLGDITLDLIVAAGTMANLASLQSAKTVGVIQITNLIDVWECDGFIASFKQNPADANSPDTMTVSVVLATTGALTVSPIGEGEFANLSPKSYSFAPDLGTVTYVHAAVTLGASAQDVSTAITNPDFPRVVSVKGNASGIAGNVVITGTDFNGTAISETIALSGATEVFGDKGFKTVTNINFPAKTNGSGDTVSIGVGDVFGLPIATPNGDLIFATSFDGAADAGTLVENASISLSVYELAGTPNGTKIVTIWYLA
mgnify:FL=1